MGKSIVRKITKALVLIKKGNCAKLKRLLHKFPEVLYLNDGDISLLHNACYISKNACKTAILNGADINIKDSLGSTVLNIYSSRGDLEMVIFLLKHGAIVDSPESLGETALSWAVYGGHLEVAKMLFKHGADIYHKLSGINNFRVIDLALKSENEEMKSWASRISARS